MQVVQSRHARQSELRWCSSADTAAGGHEAILRNWCVQAMYKSKVLPTVFLYCSQCQPNWSGLCARQGINNVSTCHMVAWFLTYSLYRSLAHSRNHSHLLTNPAQPTTYPPAHAFIRSPTHAFSSTHPPTNSATHLRPSILWLFFYYFYSIPETLECIIYSTVLRVVCSVCSLIMFPLA